MGGDTGEAAHLSEGRQAGRQPSGYPFAAPNLGTHPSSIIYWARSHASVSPNKKLLAFISYVSSIKGATVRAEGWD